MWTLWQAFAHFRDEDGFGVFVTAQAGINTLRRLIAGLVHGLVIQVYHLLPVVTWRRHASNYSIGRADGKCKIEREKVG